MALGVALVVSSACSSEVQDDLDGGQSSASTKPSETVDSTTATIAFDEDDRRAIEIARAYPFSASEVAAREGEEPPVVRAGREDGTRYVDIRFAEPVSEYVLHLSACGEGRPTDIVVGLRFDVDLEVGQVRRMTPVWINGEHCF